MAETANGCLVLHRAGTIAERQKPRAEELEKTFHALLQSASGELFSLDKDLSWMSRCGKSHQIGNENALVLTEAINSRMDAYSSAIRLCASTPLELRNFGSTDLPLGQTRTSVLYSRANCEDFSTSRMIL